MFGQGIELAQETMDLRLSNQYLGFVFLVYKCIVVYFYEIEFHTDKHGVSCVRLRMEDAQI